MITSWQLYLLTRLDSVHCAVAIVVLAATIFSLVCGIGWGVHAMDATTYSDGENNDSKRARSLKILFLKSLAVATVFLGISVVTPSTKEMAAIIIVPKLTETISKNEELQKLPNNILSLANDWIEELKPKKEEK